MLKKPPKFKPSVKSKMEFNNTVRPSSEAMMELLTLLFLNNLAQEGKAKAFEQKSGTIRAHHVKAIVKNVLKNARG
nr:centromere protein W [Syngnathus scovelli]